MAADELAAKVSSHPWRQSGTGAENRLPAADRPCVFAGCGRLRAEHERVLTGRAGRWLPQPAANPEEAT